MLNKLKDDHFNPDLGNEESLGEHLGVYEYTLFFLTMMATLFFFSSQRIYNIFNFYFNRV